MIGPFRKEWLAKPETLNAVELKALDKWLRLSIKTMPPGQKASCSRLRKRVQIAMMAHGMMPKIRYSPEKTQ